MFYLNEIELTDNATWLNEFEGSAIERSKKYTEDGRKFVYQKKRQKRDAPIILKLELSYGVLKTLVPIRDSGLAAILILEDSRQFNVLLNSIDAGAFFEDSAVFNDDDFFNVKLNFEVL